MRGMFLFTRVLEENSVSESARRTTSTEYFL